MSAKGRISSFALDKAMNYISGAPETNMPKLLGWIDALGMKSFAPQSKMFHEVLDDPDNTWYQFITPRTNSRKQIYEERKPKHSLYDVVGNA